MSSRAWGISAVGRRGPLWSSKLFDRVETPISVSDKSFVVVVCVIDVEYGRLILLPLRKLRCSVREWTRSGLV